MQRLFFNSLWLARNPFRGTTNYPGRVLQLDYNVVGRINPSVAAACEEEEEDAMVGGWLAVICEQRGIVLRLSCCVELELPRKTISLPSFCLLLRNG